MNNSLIQKQNQLHKKFKKMGAISIKYRQICIGMLPEIYKNEVYLRHNCQDIFEYAAKFAGISHPQVKAVIRLENKFKDKPALRKSLVNGKVSHHKLMRLASIATKENDEKLAIFAETHSKRAIDVQVKEIKNEQKSLPGQTFEEQKQEQTQESNQEPTQEQTQESNQEPTQKPIQDSLPDINILEHLSIKLQKDLIARHKKGIDINKLLIELLQKHDQDIEKEMKEIGEQAKPTNSNYINVKTQRVLVKKYGTKCCIHGCDKDIDDNHHLNYGSTLKVHDPRFIAPMCSGHHEIAHKKNLIYQQKLKF